MDGESPVPDTRYPIGGVVLTAKYCPEGGEEKQLTTRDHRGTQGRHEVMSATASCDMSTVRVVASVIHESGEFRLRLVPFSCFQNSFLQSLTRS